MENTTAKVSAAFVKAQSQFAPALKTSTNPHFKSKYAALDACVEAVMSALNANGIALMQQVSPVDDKQIPGVIVETIFIHESGERIHCGKLHFPVSKHDAQGYMSCLTYARRGSLMAACGIAPEDDDGNEASKNKNKKEIQKIGLGFAKVDHYSDLMNASITLAQLSENFKAAYRAADEINDVESIEFFTQLKDAKKIQLTKDK
jgi:hypothetical protein